MSTIWVTAFSWRDEQKKKTNNVCRDLDLHSCFYDVAARRCLFLSLTDVWGECAGLVGGWVGWRAWLGGSPGIHISRRTVSLPAPSRIPALGCASRRGVETRLFLGSAFLNRDWAPSHRCNKTRECHHHTQAQASSTWLTFSYLNVFTGLCLVLFYLIRRTAPLCVYTLSVYSSVG